MEYWGVMKTEPINNQFAQKRETQEYPHPGSKFQRELNEVIREALGKYIHKPRPSKNIGWSAEDGLD